MIVWDCINIIYIKINFTKIHEVYVASLAKLF